METKADCPFCGKVKHLYINTDKGVYYCHKCGRGGKLSSSLSQAIPALIKPVKVAPSKAKGAGKLRLITKEDELHWEYAKKRNSLQYKDHLYISSSFPEYIVVGLPLTTPPNFFFGRKLLMHGPRYRYFSNTKGIIAKSFDGRKREAVIVEGFFDLCNVSKHFPTIALMGKNGWKDKDKIEKIFKSVIDKAYIALDKDALQDSMALGFRLSKKLDVKFIHSDVYKDPGDSPGWVLKGIRG